MARIQTPQHVQELQAEFKVREPFGLELLETIQPTYQLGRQKIASTGYPKRCFGVTATGAGGVGTNRECALQCPADRGIVILLESFLIHNVAGIVSSRMDDGVAMATIDAVLTDKAFQDGRLADRIPDGILQAANPLTAAPNGRFIGQYSVAADNSLQINVNVILGGNSYFLIRENTANQALTVTWQWTEFLLEDR